MALFSGKKNTLKAVYDSDLVGYLKSLGLYESIIAGKHLCTFCGNKITLDNLEIIVPKDNGVEFVCNNPNCLNQI